jgi:hypothetical protein
MRIGDRFDPPGIALLQKSTARIKSAKSIPIEPMNILWNPE